MMRCLLECVSTNQFKATIYQMIEFRYIKRWIQLSVLNQCPTTFLKITYISLGATSRTRRMALDFAGLFGEQILHINDEPFMILLIILCSWRNQAKRCSALHITTITKVPIYTVREVCIGPFQSESSKQINLMIFR